MFIQHFSEETEQIQAILPQKYDQVSPTLSFSHVFFANLAFLPAFFWPLWAESSRKRVREIDTGRNPAENDNKYNYCKFEGFTNFF